MKRYIAFGYGSYDTGSPCGAYAGDFDTLDEAMAGVPALDNDASGSFEHLSVLDTTEGAWVFCEWKRGTDRKPEWRHSHTSPVKDVSNHFDD